MTEAEFGFNSDTDRLGKNSGYTASRSDMYNVDVADAWWTRSPSSGRTNLARNVLPSGIPYVDYVNYDGVAVRPAFFLNLESLIFKSGSDPSKPADEVGQFSNPYVLYLTSSDLSSASLSVNGNKLTVSFDQPVAHAYQGAANPSELAQKFTVSEGL